MSYENMGSTKEKINWNEILNRTNEVEQMKNILMNFEMGNVLSKRGIYLYGNSGIGKTTFIVDILKEMDYNIIHYDAGDIKNKSILDEIMNNNISSKSIISMFQKKVKKNILLFDEIDAMNTSDKGGLNNIIKLIRPKKTKKQKTEKILMIPIIFIGNYYVDKKIKELMKVCHLVELKTPTHDQMKRILDYYFPDSYSFTRSFTKENVENPQKQNREKEEMDEERERKMEEMIAFIQNDFRKLHILIDLFQNPSLNQSNIYELLESILCLKSYNENTKETVRKLMLKNHSMKDHTIILNETERTIIGLLWHENIVNSLEKQKTEASIPFYLKQLENMCFADYIDKITFQNQIWQFNEMSSLLKTFYNHTLFHETSGISNDWHTYTQSNKETEIRFTKVLTKYSTEYNNFLFLQYLCIQLGMDKKDLITFFTVLKEKYDDYNEVLPFFENYEISKLNIQRIYRFLDNNIKDDKKVEMDEVDEEEFDIDNSE